MTTFLRKHTGALVLTGVGVLAGVATAFVFTAPHADAQAAVFNRSVVVNAGASPSTVDTSVTISVSGTLSTRRTDDECVSGPGIQVSFTHWWQSVGTSASAEIVSGPFAGSSIPLSVSPGRTGTGCNDVGEVSTYSGFRTFDTTGLANGSYSADVRVSDNIGGSNTSSGFFSASFTVQHAAPTVVTVDLRPSPKDIFEGQSSTLSWTSTNADFCDFSLAGGFTGTSGSVSTGALDRSRTFSIACATGDLSASDTDSVRINVSPRPDVTVSLTTSRTEVVSGERVTLTWSSQNANFCNFAPAGGFTGTNGSVLSGPITSDPTTFSITCATTDLSSSATAEVTVAVPGSTNKEPIGSHDGNNNERCEAFGWAADPNDLSEDVTINVYSDGALVTSSTAGSFRGDLTGVCPNGTCAFVVGLDGLITSGVSHSIEVRAVDTTTGAERSLPGTPKPITCTEEGGTIVVNSNIDTTWSLSGPSAQAQGTPTQSQTYPNLAPGTYTLDPAKLAGFEDPVVSPQSKSHTLTSDSTRTFTITYERPPNEPKVDLRINGTDGPAVVAAGGQVNLSWTSENATECRAEGDWSGPKPINETNDPEIVSAGGESYTLTCTGSGGTISDTVSAVVGSSNDPVVDLRVNGGNSATVTSGSNVLLTWSSVNTSSCTASGDWGGPRATSNSTGVLRTNLTSDKTYSLTCVSPSGRADVDTVTVTVSNNALPIGFHGNNINSTCSVYGWAVDPDDRSTDLTIRFYSDGSLVKTATADDFRSDLLSHCTGGTCGYFESLSGLITPGVAHSIRVAALDAQTGQEKNLNGTPKLITCSASEGTIVVNSNQPITWTLNGPEQQQENTPKTSVTYSDLSAGTYTLVVPTLPGFNPATIVQGQSQPLVGGGTTTFDVTYTPINSPPPPPPPGPGSVTATLTADPVNVPSGRPSTLTWSSNGDNCWLDGVSLGSSNGSQSTGALTASQTYTLLCTRGGVSASDTADVIVAGSPPAPAVAAIIASPETVSSGQASILIWTSANATACTLDGAPVGLENIIGQSTGPLSSPQTFTLLCSNATSNDSDSATVTVSPPPPPPPPAFGLSGGNIEVTFTGGGATSTATTITVNPEPGFSDSVSLSAQPNSIQGADVTYTFSDPTLSSSEYSTGSQLQLRVDAPIASGSYPITIEGNGGGIIRITTITLSVDSTRVDFEEF